MRCALVVLALFAGSAKASEIAKDDPPILIVVSPPPPPPPPPPPVREPIEFGNRFTATAAFGGLWLQVDGQLGSGPALQPTLNRTFDRAELQVDLLLADWRYVAAMDPVTGVETGVRGGIVARLGASARYQAARVRVDRSLSLDLVVEAGAGVERLSRDEGGSVTRPDLALGLGLRQLGDVTTGARSRVYFGLEATLRLLVAPQTGDLAFVFAFGVPLGR